MSQSFSTDLIPPADRLDAWLCNARQICGDCQFQIHRHSPFHGSIERRRVAGLELTLFSSTALSFSKFPAVNSQPENRACIIITQLAGVRQYRQDGKVAVLSKGDTTLIDSALPWTSNCAGDCARLYLRIPFSALERSLHGVRIPNARRISGTRGLGAALFQLMKTLYQQAGNLNDEEGVAALEAYLRMLSACISGPRLASCKTESSSRTLFSCVLSYINRHLTDPTLCPTEIASAAGISVRHLHRLFARQGSTVNDWIRAQRLRHCWQELADPHARKSITEIALYWGFSDSAHFSHSFKKQFGISPRQVRQRPWFEPEADRIPVQAYPNLSLRQITLS